MVKEFKSVYARQETINTKHLIPKWSPGNFSVLCIRFFLWYSDYSAESGKFGAFKKKELEKNKLVRKQN